MKDVQLEKLDDYRWIIPSSYMEGMRVPGLIFASEKMLEHIRLDQTPKQVANVAHLPGIIGKSMAMPDIHWGYGFPIGGVAGMDVETGVISPGGVGYDINCGVRMIRTNLNLNDITNKLRDLVNALYNNIPSGVGSKGDLRLTEKDERAVMINGSKWVVEQGFGWQSDLEFCEENGQLVGADPDRVGGKAYERGKGQLGTLGSGNHFLEVQIVDEIYDDKIAQTLGLYLGQIVVMIHTGSRGFGYQICDDYLESMVNAMRKYGIVVPDKQLACAPISSNEGKAYLNAMACAANYAWANRQYITHWVRQSFEQIFGMKAEKLGMTLIYDVAHNIAKIEEHIVDGKKIKVCVHRKGATRAFPPGHIALPSQYKSIGQPVLIPGDMGRNSYILVGTQKAMEETFGSTSHGAGRVLSRTKAIQHTKGRAIHRELEDKGIIVRSHGKDTLREEAPDAYKNVDDVVEVVHNAGISKKVAKMRPLGVVKG